MSREQSSSDSSAGSDVSFELLVVESVGSSSVFVESLVGSVEEVVSLVDSESSLLEESSVEVSSPKVSPELL